MSDNYTTTGTESEALNERLKCSEVRKATVAMDEHRALEKELAMLNHKYHEEVKKTNRYRLALLRILDQE